MKDLRPAVFLDRDGVLNRTAVRGGTPHPPATLAEVEVLPGVEAALRRLRERGLPLIVVTNQPDVARGTQQRSVVEEINQSLARRLGLTAVYTCYHDNADDCACRKPRPGMLARAAEEHGIDLARSYMVGDRWGDVAAGAVLRGHLPRYALMIACPSGPAVFSHSATMTSPTFLNAAFIAASGSRLPSEGTAPSYARSP